MEINVVDSIMGSGKTTAAINYINESNELQKFIYITPYLDEVDRIMTSCKGKHFYQPNKYKDYVPKIIDFKKLLSEGKNIVTTHALFYNFDQEIIDLCYSQGYELIMDEVVNVIKPYELEKDDAQILIDTLVKVDDNGILRWKEETNYSGNKFDTEKRLCELECLAMYSNNIMVWLFPINIFKAFRKIFVLTYMFQAQMQKYYYDFYGITYKYLYVEHDDKYHFTDKYISDVSKYDYRKLIHILEDEKLNMIGDDEYSLGKAWYERNKNNGLMKQLKNNVFNFFNNKKIINGETSKAEYNLWTTFTDYKSLVAGKGYTKGFIPSNLRATNKYRNKFVIAYVINKFFNPLLKNFFTNKGVEIDEDSFAVSEMVQFIWRSGIRDGKEIYIYIPSNRMRTLLKEWIANQNYIEVDNGTD